MCYTLLVLHFFYCYYHTYFRHVTMLVIFDILYDLNLDHYLCMNEFEASQIQVSC